MVMTTAAALGAGSAAAGSGSLLGTLGLAAIPGIVSGVVNGLFGWKTDKDNREHAEELNSQNLAFQREQFEYQKYLNENQFQMMSQDAAKAGINPLAMSGGNVSSSSFSGSSVQANQTPINVGDIGSFLSPVLNYKLGMQQQRLDEKKTNLELQLGYEQLHEQRRNNNMIDKLQRDLSESQSKENSKNRAKDLIIAAAQNVLSNKILAETKRSNLANEAETKRNNDLLYDLGLGSQALSSYLAPFQANLMANQGFSAYQSAYGSWLNNLMAAHFGLPVGVVPDDGLLGDIFGSTLSRVLTQLSGKLRYPLRVDIGNSESSESAQKAIKDYIEARKKKGGKK